MDILKDIEKVLKSDAGLIIDDKSEVTVIDNRFLLVKEIVNSIKNESDDFYTELIKLIANNIDHLYDDYVRDFPTVVYDEDRNIIPQEYNELNSSNMFHLTNANRKFAQDLFKYVCIILYNHKDVKLDVETLKRLLNRNPKLFSFSVEESYLFRTFDFEKLAKLLNKNNTLEKSNISIDEIYQILIDTCQINNDSIFGNLVNLEQYKENHQKVDEILTWCNAKTFVEIIRIIKKNFDKELDVFSIVKKRNKNKFYERLIIEILNSHANNEEYDLIHQILTDPDIEIDYKLYSTDYSGQTDLKSTIALSKNRTLINDLLKKEKNIQNYYSHGDFGIELYSLYAIVGDYEKALENFEAKYNFKHDLDDEDNYWDRFGYAHGSYGYEDSLARFISKMCNSFKEDGVEYSKIVNYIKRIINSKNITYINLIETLKPIKEVLTGEDFKLLIQALLEKHNSGNLGFVVVNECFSTFDRYIINIAKEDEIESQLNEISGTKVYTKKDDIKH